MFDKRSRNRTQTIQGLISIYTGIYTNKMSRIFEIIKKGIYTNKRFHLINTGSKIGIYECGFYKNRQSVCFCDLRVYTPYAAVRATPGAISVVSDGYWKVLTDFRASGSPLDALTVCYPTD